MAGDKLNKLCNKKRRLALGVNENAPVGGGADSDRSATSVSGNPGTSVSGNPSASVSGNPGDGRDGGGEGPFGGGGGDDEGSCGGADDDVGLECVLRLQMYLNIVISVAHNISC